jgi:hypothetical protein
MHVAPLSVSLSAVIEVALGCQRNAITAIETMMFMGRHIWAERSVGAIVNKDVDVVKTNRTLIN